MSRKKEHRICDLLEQEAQFGLPAWGPLLHVFSSLCPHFHSFHFHKRPLETQKLKKKTERDFSQILPTVQDKYGDDACIFQHNGAPWSKTAQRSGPGHSPGVNADWKTVISPQGAGGEGENYKLRSSLGFNAARMDLHRSRLVHETDIQHGKGKEQSTP